MDRQEATKITLKIAGYSEEEIKAIEKEAELKKLITNFHNKRHLAEQFIKIQPLYYDEGKNWWVWDSNDLKWRIIDETDIMNLVGKLSNANTVNSKEKNEILEALKQQSRSNKPKSINPTWIQFKDNIIDVQTGETIKASPEYFVTNPIPWNFHSDNFEETPNMDKIFEEWVGKEHVKSLYEILAYCLLPNYPIHRLFCFIGVGMNGKSCFLKLLSKFIGQDNVTCTELDTLLNSRFEVTRLHKKLVCIMGETNFSELNKTSIIKKLTGGDLIGFEYKNKTPFTDKNYAKIIIATNNLPTTTDKTIGFYRRWLIKDFPNQFSEQKEILDDIPDEEYESLALKSVYILKELLKKRKFTNEGTIEERIKQYEDKSNPFEKFFKEYMEDDTEGSIWSFQLSKKLNQWCMENKFRQFSDETIAKQMKEKGFSSGKKYSDWLIDGKHKQLRCWNGVKWKD